MGYNLELNLGKNLGESNYSNNSAETAHQNLD
jgi:hypothetical protein